MSDRRSFLEWWDSDERQSEKNRTGDSHAKFQAWLSWLAAIDSQRQQLEKLRADYKADHDKWIEYKRGHKQEMLELQQQLEQKGAEIQQLQERVKELENGIATHKADTSLIQAGAHYTEDLILWKLIESTQRGGYA